jgi:Na+-driven multidrug efflux pump
VNRLLALFRPGNGVRAVRRQTVSLGWPVAVQQTLTTLMRTVDILVTGFFLRRRSP